MLRKRKIDLISIMWPSCFRQQSGLTWYSDKSNDHSEKLHVDKYAKVY